MKKSVFVHLVLLSIIVCLSVPVRIYMSNGSTYYRFLIWNLFLAWIPFVLSNYLSGHRLKLGPKSVLLVVTWLLFFPNGPYIITDLLHLKVKNGIPIWYDSLMIFSFACLGLLLALLSLSQVVEWLKVHIGKFAATLASVVVPMLSGFAIYIGRFQRWNSWDVVRHPFALCQDVIHLIVNFRYNSIITFSVLFGTYIFVAYFVFIKIIRTESNL